MRPFASEFEVIKELLPLGDSIITAVMTVGAGIGSYFIGKKKQNQELENLKAEKKAIESEASSSLAEATRMITDSASAILGPITIRLKEQTEENRLLREMNLFLNKELEQIKVLYQKALSELERIKENSNDSLS